ncbi:MAG: hypothetical protein M5R41_19335 [Bacteroidia bacterium]|nr:hypothetical protein [Bacteroidia bacterium]
MNASHMECGVKTPSRQQLTVSHDGLVTAVREPIANEYRAIREPYPFSLFPAARLDENLLQRGAVK